MSGTTAPARQQWSGQWGFIISAVGSAVGLGNIWRFPGVAYSHGGGAFMIPYLVALLTAGIPILFLDYAIGHRFRGSAPLAFRRIKNWLEGLGWFQVMICFFIMIYYAAILAWAGSYFVFSFTFAWGDDPAGFLTGTFLQVSDPAAGMQFTPALGVFIPLIVIWILVMLIMALDIVKGLERVNKIFIPLLLVAFVILVIYALFLPGAVDGLNQLFTPQFDALLDPSVWIAAYAQIFFSLSIAFGIMLTYSSYRRRKANLTAPGLVVGFANSSFELLAGLGVFSALGFMAAQQGVPIDELGGLTGVGLSFITFPTIIAAMPGGQFFGALFFGSLLMAGFTSLVSIFEVVLAGIMDKFNVNRVKGTICIGIPTALISMFCFGVTSGLTTLDIVDKWTNEVGIVLSAVLMIVGVIWILRRDEELALHLSAISTFKVGTIWRILVGNISPLILLFIFIQTVLSLLQEGYGGYPQEYLNTAGWGVFAIMVIGSVIFSVIPWRRNPDDFVVWPTYVKGGLK